LKEEGVDLTLAISLLEQAIDQSQRRQREKIKKKKKKMTMMMMMC